MMPFNLTVLLFSADLADTDLSQVKRNDGSFKLQNILINLMTILKLQRNEQ